jgi:hypothetical protein
VKKTFKLMFLTLILLLLGIASINVSAREKGISLEDESTIKAMIFQLASEEGKDLEGFSYTFKNVYFANEEWAGYVIDFTSNNKIGYTIVFNIEGNLKIIELFFGRRSPYYEKTGIPIYCSLGYYFIKHKGKIVEVSNQKPMEYYENKLDEDALFFGSNGKSKDKDGTDETISTAYLRGYIYSYELPNFYTGYSTGLTSHKNNCANAAGLILLNYWNKKFNNDLLKLDASLLSSSNNISSNSSQDARKEFMGIFYDYMNTNWIFGTGGTLPVDCYKGFEKLITEKGYKVSRDRNISYTEIREKIINGIPVIITSTDYYFSNRTNKTSLPSVTNVNGSHTLSIDYEHSWGLANAHTVIGYGYTYYSLYKDVQKSVWSPVWYNPFRYITVTETVNFYEELIKIADGWGGNCFFSYTHSNVYDNAAIKVYK